MREERGWERRAGMILEVRLRNFMCHEVRDVMAKMTSLVKYRLAGVQFQAQSAAQLPLRGEWKWKVCSKTNSSIVSETQVNNFEVLSAIVFGLGGSARTANRGTTNKGFIRWLFGKY